MQNRMHVVATQALASLSIVWLLFLRIGASPAAAQTEPKSIAISPDGTRLYVSQLWNEGSSGPIRVIDTTGLRWAAILNPSGARWQNTYIYSMAVSPDGSRLYVGRYDGVDVVDPAGNQLLATVPANLWPISMSTSPDGSHLYVARIYPGALATDPNNPKGGLTVIDTGAGKAVTTIGTGQMTQFAATSPDGRRIYAIGCDCAGGFDTAVSTLSVINAGTLQTVNTLSLPWSVAGAVLSQDGKRIYIAARFMFHGGGASVLVYDTQTNQIAATVKMDRSAYQPLISPDGKRLYLTMIDGPDTIRVLDTENLRITGTLLLPVTPARSSANPLAFTPDALSPDGKQLYFVNSQGDVVWVIDTASLEVKATIKLQ